MKRFSKFKKQINSFFVSELKMEFCCYAYPMRTQFGSTSIPRFCVKLGVGKEVIWDCPKNIRVPEQYIHYWSAHNNVSDLIRDYINTPIDKLLDTKFEKENWVCDSYDGKKFDIKYGLIDLFKAADRRLGKDKLFKWAQNNRNYWIFAILSKRFGKNKSDKVPHKLTADGIKYIVVRHLPKDQLLGFRKGTGCYTCLQFDEEKDDEFCLYYRDYENFYDNWIIGRDAFHLD